MTNLGFELVNLHLNEEVKVKNGCVLGHVRCQLRSLPVNAHFKLENGPDPA
eukprot:COSAG06_NODE_4383_length_4313_cov_4.422164_3_plen_51_part_00